MSAGNVRFHKIVIFVVLMAFDIRDATSTLDYRIVYMLNMIRSCLECLPQCLVEWCLSL